MEQLAPLPFVVPLATAVVLTAIGSMLPRRVGEGVGLLAGAGTFAVAMVLFVDSFSGTIVQWIAGWAIRQGLAIGIALTLDPVSTGAAAFVALLTLAALVFSIRYFDVVMGHRYHVLLFLFEAGMIGFILSGDLFNMFVFFELLSVAAYALTGHQIEQPGPIQAGINFAVVNTIGSLLFLIGIGLLYGKTGALNLAQIGEDLAGLTPDGAVVVAFAAIAVGLFVKAALVPFHFWLADAYAVAPTPVCILFAGAMSKLPLFVLAKIYWHAFSGVFSDVEASVGTVIVYLGAVTAVLGAVMAFAQQHLKRLVAFSVISHVGLVLVGIGLWDIVGLAGAGLYAIGVGLAEAALFMSIGILNHRLHSVHEERLRDRGRRLAWTGAGVVLAGLALAGAPPFATYAGRGLIEHAAASAGFYWVPGVFGFAAAVTAGAVLRVVGRVFLGWGPDEPQAFASERYGPEEQNDEGEEPETEEGEDRTPPVMAAPLIVLIAVLVGVTYAPGIVSRSQHAAAAFVDRTGVVAAVLHDEPRVDTPLHVTHLTPKGIYYGVAAAAGAAFLAVLAVFRQRLPQRVREATQAVFLSPLQRLRGLHSGYAGDYVAWLVLGAATLTGMFSLAAR